MLDWNQLHSELPPPAVVDPRLRLRLGLAAFWLMAAVVLVRVMLLEWRDGETFREVAARPLVHRQSLPGSRGRILARDGSVLAHDEQLVSLAVRYRQLEQPPNARWLKAQARSRLTRAERRQVERMAEAEAQVLAERDELHRRLAELCGLSPAQWQARTARVQARVTEISRRVNERQPRAADQSPTLSDPPPDSFWQRAVRRMTEFLGPEEQLSAPPIVVAEEHDAHVMAQGLPLGVVAEVEAHPDRYPGVQIVYQWRRSYPAGSLAAHLLGHLGAADAPSPESHPDDRVGRMGVEQQYEALLRGRRGEAVETRERSGELIRQHRVREPTAGRDLVLTLDLALQRTAESLLDSACQRRASLAADDAATAGGAIVALDVHSGAVLAAASAPRFDPNVFAAAMPAHALRDIATLLADPAHPLFDRTARMALPPGSVFKPLSAVALLESGGLDPRRPIACRGYFEHTNAQRCEIFTRYGIGHEQVTLGDALAQSCNVYFYQTTGEMGVAPLVDWARRFGFGRPSGVDLPSESAGRVPNPAAMDAGQDVAWRLADTQALAIGQSSLTVTPLQVARMMAAIANGGLLVTPHVVAGLGLTQRSDDPSETADAAEDDDVTVAPPQPIAGLRPSTLAAIREGLERVVADPQGTAHDTVYLDEVAIAGKTGTAQSGGGREDHAWFAGYCPADAPRVAFVIVLEHAGSGSTAAGPVARRLVERMQQLGYFNRRSTSDRRTTP